jgi:bifunctional ADP-heptose synthase (sugar kinase/adenylyltransferase)
LFLDTRTKIVPLHEVAERLHNGSATRISGHFDPLLAEHIQRLAEARKPGRQLVVEITNPVQPLLAQRARAELVAALSVVDFVVLGDVEPGVDADISARFIEHVLLRHGQESQK